MFPIAFPPTTADLAQLRTIPIPALLATLRVPVLKQADGLLRYQRAPLPAPATAGPPLDPRGADISPQYMLVDPVSNRWQEFAASGELVAAGDVIELVMYMGETDQAGALAFLAPLRTGPPPTADLAPPSMPDLLPAVSPARDTRLQELELRPLQEPALVQFLRTYGIDAPSLLAGNRPLRTFLLEASYRLPTRSRRYHNVAWRTQLGGDNVELWGPSSANGTFTRRHGPRCYSLVPGTDGTRARLHVVATFLDYLSLLMQVQHPALLADVLVLNGVALPRAALGEALAVAVEYEELWLWLGPERAGRTTADFWTAHHPRVVDQGEQYAGYACLNDLLLDRPMREATTNGPARGSASGATRQSPAQAQWWLYARWVTPQLDAQGALRADITYYAFTNEPVSLDHLKRLRTRLAQAGKIRFSRLCERRLGPWVEGQPNYLVLEQRDHFIHD